MNKKPVRRSPRSQRSRIVNLGEDFKRYYRIWLTTDGQIKAGEWMSGHIGWLNGEIANLKSRLRKLERNAKKQEPNQ